MPRAGKVFAAEQSIQDLDRQTPIVDDGSRPRAFDLSSLAEMREADRQEMADGAEPMGNYELAAAIRTGWTCAPAGEHEPVCVKNGIAKTVGSEESDK